MNEIIKTKKEVMLEIQKERHLAELFNKCMQLMNRSYRQLHAVQVTQ